MRSLPLSWETKVYALQNAGIATETLITVTLCWALVAYNSTVSLR